MLLLNIVDYVFLLLRYVFIFLCYTFLLLCLYILTVRITYSYSYVCFALGILFHFVVLCTVCVYLCTVLLSPAVNTTAVNKYIIEHHLVSK